MARSIVSFGMLAPRALSTAVRSRGLPVMSAPPVRAETVISRIILVQTFDFFESEASFLCLIFDHRLWPDMPLFLTTTPRASGEPGRASGRAGARRRHERAVVPGVPPIAGRLHEAMNAVPRPRDRRDVDPAAVARDDGVALQEARDLAAVREPVGAEARVDAQELRARARRYVGSVAGIVRGRHDERVLTGGQRRR